MRHLLTDMTPEKDGQMVIDMEDEAVRGATVINAGEITWPPPAPKLSAAPAKPAEAPAVWKNLNRKKQAQLSKCYLLLSALWFCTLLDQ